MKPNKTHGPMVVLAAFAVSIVLLCACSDRRQMSNRVIVQNEIFTLTGDSIIEDTVIAYSPDPSRIVSNVTVARLDSLYGDLGNTPLHFVHGKTWRARSKRPFMMPEYDSGQPLIDALYLMSTDYIADAVDKSGRFNPSNNNYSRLYCSIFLSLAALKPHQSMATLRSIVDRDSIIMQREGQWPVVSDHIGWATAAWEVYKVTGDRNWLAYSRRVIEKTLGINSAVLLDHETGLIHGAGYTSSKPLGVRRMTWMSYNDLFACMSLGNNILTGNAYAILAEMCDELGIENSYEKDAQRLKDAINQYLWNENKGFYSSFLYGMAYPRQAPLTDNTSQAMCVLWGIADDNRAENLIAQTPITYFGVNVSYPAASAIEPYFTNSSWATTQAMWNLAAAYVRNENALRYGLGALYRTQALYQSRGIHIDGVAIDNLGTCASNAAMILRVMAGMHFSPEGIEFAPMVPECMPGKKTLSGLHYRQAVLDVTIHGTGNDVESITDNGNPLEGPFIPGNIQGHHHIVIMLKEGSHSSGRVTIHPSEAMLPPTPVVTWSGDSGHIVDFVPGTPYRLSVNGHLDALNDSVFGLPDADSFTEFSVEIAGKFVNGFMSRPLFHFGLTPQVAFIPDAELDTATVTVSVAEGGDYLIDVGYRPTGTLDVRRVSANGHTMGTLVMAGSNVVEQNGLAYSNMVNAKLLKGSNTITLTIIRLPKAFTSCEPVHLRVIKRN